MGCKSDITMFYSFALVIKKTIKQALTIRYKKFTCVLKDKNIFICKHCQHQYHLPLVLVRFCSLDYPVS